MSLDAALISPVENAKNNLQKTIDRYTTPDYVDLAIINGPVTVTLDPAKGDQGFSYMAKRAYKQGAKYTEKQALKAALLLSKSFMDATRDPKLQVKADDSLTIGPQKAVLTREEKIGSRITTKTYEVIVGDPTPVVSYNEIMNPGSATAAVRAETKTELQALKPSSAGQKLLGFTSDIPSVRRALGLTGFENPGVVASTTLFQRSDYPAYQFTTLAVTVQNNQGVRNFGTWDIGVNSSGRYIVIDRESNQVTMVANLEEVQDFLKNSIKNRHEHSAPPIAIETDPSVPSLRDFILKMLLEKGYQTVAWKPYLLPNFHIEGFLVTAIQDSSNKKVQFYIAYNSEENRYQLGAGQPWKDQVAIQQELSSLLV